MPFMIDGYAVAGAVEMDADHNERYAVWPSDLPGCIAEGSSLGEAVTRLRTILPAYKASFERRGVALPAPTAKEPAISVQYVSFSQQTGAIPESELLLQVA